MKNIGGILLILVFVMFSFEVIAKSSQRAKKLENPLKVDFISSTPLVEESSFVDFDRIYVRNSCSKTIWVAIHYFNLDKSWKTISWFRLSPGDKQFLAKTKNRMIYVHAITADGTQIWRGEDSRFLVHGLNKAVGFKSFRVTSDSWGEWTHILTCQSH
jgi:hypothetical protein